MKSDFIRIAPDLDLHFEQAGRGERVILLVPGWTMSTRVFERQLEFFDNSSTYRCISFDPRGHGLSSKTADGHYYEQHGRDLHAFIDRLGLDQIVLGGWSFGCLATLSWINQFGSERLRGFIMLDGPPRAAGRDNRSEWVTYQYDDADGSAEFYTLGRLRDPANNNRAFAAWMLEDKTEEKIRWVLEITEQTPDSAAALLNASALYLDYESDLRALEGRLPLWYLLREDQLEIVENWAHQNTPSAEVQAFGEHLMFWERAATFNAALVEFAQRCFRDV